MLNVRHFYSSLSASSTYRFGPSPGNKVTNRNLTNTLSYHREPVIKWLLDSDPSIRWQVMNCLTDASEAEVAAERARVATEGFGSRLLVLQGPDGRWGGAAWNRG